MPILQQWSWLARAPGEPGRVGSARAGLARPREGAKMALTILRTGSFVGLRRPISRDGKRSARRVSPELAFSVASSTTCSFPKRHCRKRASFPRASRASRAACWNNVVFLRENTFSRWPVVAATCATCFPLKNLLKEKFFPRKQVAQVAPRGRGPERTRFHRNRVPTATSLTTRAVGSRSCTRPRHSGNRFLFRRVATEPLPKRRHVTVLSRRSREGPGGHRHGHRGWGMEWKPGL